MRRNTYTSLFMVASVVTILNFSSCSGDEKEGEEAVYSIASIHGEWEVVKMQGMVISEGEYSYYSAEFEFEEDGDFEFQYGYTYDEETTWYTYKGEWEWEKENTNLNISFDGETRKFEIKELTDTKLNMIDDEGEEWELVRDK